MAAPSAADRLRELLEGPGLLQMPGCFDAMSARLIEQTGFRLGFMSGFAVSASHLAGPDTGLMSLGEMLDRGREICAATSIPMVGDGDTGFGNAVSVRRTVQGYADAGFACVMIEDQVAPKRCGHTEGKEVVPRDEAEIRLQAALDARNEGADILVMGRTDARGPLGLDEAIERARRFAEMGADITFLEAPRDEHEMAAYCDAVPGPKMANMIEHGVTPILPPRRLEEIGYRIAVYPLTQLSAAIRAMRDSLAQIHETGEADNVLEFSELTEWVGFPEYHRLAKRYSD
ncbi:MAG: isocitrate lyase/PEP mutase family protein [Halofilum sp. (in: g-proteobacteria)]|nr:isocitrate lyase/PEP mutase family protein [Halofilum sp. (in: g-proteobacteria)]